MTILGKYIKHLGLSVDREIQGTVGKLLPKGKVSYLDVGCDDGVKTRIRADTIGTGKVFGLEKVKTRAALAGRRGIKMAVGDLNKKWELPSDYFTCLTATEVIEHLVDLDNFFMEANRVMKKKGTIILSTENLASYHNIFALILGNQPYSGPFLSRKYPIGHRPNADYWKSEISSKMEPHLNVMTAKSLESLLSFYGFRVEKTEGVGFYPLPSPFFKLFSGLDKYHASYVVVKAKKVGEPK